MKFAEPIWLLAGLAACGLLIWTWLRYDARQRKSLAAFATSHLHAQLTASFSTLRRNWQRALFTLSVALLFVALARPQAGFRWEEVKRKGVEILFAVDTSKSMLTPDAKPDRLTRAKLAIEDFVGHLDGDGVGLVAFAGNAFLQCPITLDYNAFNESLDAIDTNTIPRRGTDITSAITEAQASLANRPGSDKILILLTDGEDLEGSAIDAAKAAAQSGLKIYTVGVGSSNGDLIPVPAENGGGFVKDASGQYVKSHLNENALKAIAQATGGAYAPLGAQGQGLDQIYQSYIAPLTKHDLASRQQKIYIERFQWPLTASLVLLLASLLIGTRKNIKRSAASLMPPVPMMPRKRMTQVATAATFAAALLLLPVSQAHASLSTAEAAYKKGDYANAQKEYTAAAIKQPDKNVLQFNAGAAAYKAGQYSQAAEDFQKSLGAQQSASADPAQLAAQQDAYYNLGNTLYRTGQKTEKDKADETIKTWEQSIKSYDSALQLRKDDADAKYNRDLVQKKLDELKKQQQEQQQKQNQDQKNQDQKNQSGQGSDNKDRQDKQDQSKNDKDQQGKSGQNSNDKNVAKNDQQKQDGQQDQSKSGQDKKDQANNQGQGQQDQQKNPGQQPDQNQTAQNQGKQDQNAGNKPDQQQSQQANNGSQGQQPQGTQPKDQQPNGNGSQVAQNQKPDQNGQDQRDEPGDMSKQEAKQLLDSLRGEQKQLPGTPMARSEGNNNQNDQPIKDW